MSRKVIRVTTKLNKKKAAKAAQKRQWVRNYLEAKIANERIATNEDNNAINEK